MHVDQTPAAGDFPINLRLPAVGREGRTVFPPRGVKIPVEFRPGCVLVDVDDYVADKQVPFGEILSHKTPVDVLLDFLKTVFPTEWMDERNLWRVPPDTGGQARVRKVDRFCILGDEFPDRFACRFLGATARRRLNPRSRWPARLGGTADGDANRDKKKSQ